MDTGENRKKARGPRPSGGLRNRTRLSLQLPEEWRPRFLKAFAECGMIAHAAKVVGVGRKTVYDHLKKDRDFAAELEQSMEEAQDVLELEARRRAVEGVEVPVMGKVGKDEYGEIGRVRKYSDGLLALLLKGRRREVFGSNREVHIQGNTHVEVTVHLTKDEWDRRLREAGLWQASPELAEGPERTNRKGV